MTLRVCLPVGSPRPFVVPLLFGLAVAVEARPDGFAPKAEHDGLALFGALRWQGWADAVLGGYAGKLMVVGGVEAVEPDMCPPEARWMFDTVDGLVQVPRGFAACHALEHAYRVPGVKLAWRVSEGHTAGNAAALVHVLEGKGREDAAVSTNHYHVPRAIWDLTQAGCGDLRVLPAEAFTLARAGRGRDAALVRLEEALGGGPLARRVAAEIGGAADKINGVYVPRGA